jgi:hypothetical protein
MRSQRLCDISILEPPRESSFRGAPASEHVYEGVDRGLRL